MKQISACSIIGIIFLVGGLVGVVAFPLKVDVATGYNLLSIFFVLLGLNMIDFSEFRKEEKA